MIPISIPWPPPSSPAADELATNFTAYQNYKQMTFGEGASGANPTDVQARWPALLSYHSGNLCRLVEVKRQYDPHLVFDFAQGIPLEAPPGAC